MHEDRQRAAEIEDPFLRRSVKTALHLRQYLPFYVFGTIWVVTLAAFPIIRSDDGGDRAPAVAAGTPAGDSGAGAAADAGDATTAASDALDGTAATGMAAGPGSGPAAPTAAGGASRTGGTKAASGATAAVAPGGNAAVSAQQAQEAIQRGVGKARLGFDCKPDLGQMPGSTYALPCQNVYDGPNGGATDRGVTDKEIIIVNRKFPESANSRATTEVTKQAGFADPKVTEQTRNEMIPYFNKTYELYGRQVKWIDYESENGNSTDEAQSKGKEGACLDADKIVKELHAFAVYSGSQPFSDCAAERHLLTFQASAYFPEKYFAKYHPYQWAIIMDCERIAYQTSEYMAKRLINRPAKFAGDVTMRTKNRVFGTYVPDNDGYQYCVDTYKNELRNTYQYKDPMPQYNYQLDISRFPDQAAQAAVQFAADGVTTVVLACDFISTVVLTAAAERQQWRPEWFTIGVGAVDLDNSARLYEQNQVNGHLYGMSQLGDATRLIGPTSEAGQIYKVATGKTIPEGTSGEYWNLVHMFNLLQAAGPVLTPANIAKGAPTIPVRGQAPFPYGRWSMADTPRAQPGLDHTEVQDAREVYWVSKDCGSTCTNSASDPYYNGPDGKNGTFKVTYNGERFVSGAWPEGDPPIYPAH
jgi:hypothetical protein